MAICDASQEQIQTCERALAHRYTWEQQNPHKIFSTTYSPSCNRTFFLVNSVPSLFLCYIIYCPMLSSHTYMVCLFKYRYSGLRMRTVAVIRTGLEKYKFLLLHSQKCSFLLRNFHSQNNFYTLFHTSFKIRHNNISPT